MRLLSGGATALILITTALLQAAPDPARGAAAQAWRNSAVTYEAQRTGPADTAVPIAGTATVYPVCKYHVDRAPEEAYVADFGGRIYPAVLPNDYHGGWHPRTIATRGFVVRGVVHLDPDPDVKRTAAFEVTGQGSIANLAAAHTLAAADTMGTKKVLFLRVDFSDQPGVPEMNLGDAANARISAPFTTAEATELAAAVKAHYLNSSYGKLTLNITVPDKVYRAPQTLASYANGWYAITSDMRTAMTDYKFADFDKIVIFADQHYSLAGASGIGGGQYAIVVNAMFAVVVHELGHCFGLGHSGGNIANDYPFSRILRAEQYGNLDCIMGGANLPQQDFCLPMKCELGWLDDSNIVQVAKGTTGTFRLFSYDRVDGPNTNTLANKSVGLRIAKDATHDVWVYVNRYRVTPHAGASTNTGCSVYLTMHDFGAADFLANAGADNGVFLTQDPAIRQGGLQAGKSTIDYASGFKLTTLADGEQDGIPYSDVRLEWINDTPHIGAFTLNYGAADRVAGAVEGYSQSACTYRWDQSSNPTGPWTPIGAASASDSLAILRADYAGMYISATCTAAEQTVRSVPIQLPRYAVKYDVTELPWTADTLPGSVVEFGGKLYGIDQDGIGLVAGGQMQRLYSRKFYNAQQICDGDDKLFVAGNNSIYSFDPALKQLTTLYDSPDQIGPMWVGYDRKTRSVVWRELSSFLRMNVETGQVTVLAGHSATRSFSEDDLHAALGIPTQTTLSFSPTLQNGSIVLFSTAFVSRIDVVSGQITTSRCDRKNDQIQVLPYNETGFFGIYSNSGWVVLRSDGSIARSLFNYATAVPFAAGDESTATVGMPSFLASWSGGFIAGFTNYPDGRKILAKITVIEASPPKSSGPIVNSTTGSADQSLAITAGGSLTLSVPRAAAGTLYQWRKDGAAIIGATGATFTIAAVSPETAGAYDLVLTNSFGAISSPVFTLRVIQPPKIVNDLPAAQAAAAGTHFTLGVQATGGDLGYQWVRNGSAVPEATAANYTFESITAADAATYAVIVKNIAGTVTSTSCALRLGEQQLSNISSRSSAGLDDAVQIAGFVIAGEGKKTVLVRANGPTLGTLFHIGGVLNDPYLELYRGSVLIAANDNWDASGGDAIARAAKTAGAFSWTAGSKDAALLVTLDPGAYTAIVKGADGGTGIALTEVYDADGREDTRLTNISTRSTVTTGDAVLIAGFVITGNVDRQMLVRASGPALAELSHLNGCLADPVVELYDSAGTLLQSNDNWDADATTGSEISSVATKVGAFSWRAGSKDAALVRTLGPGRYTAIVRGVNNGGGIALVEVYQVR